MGLLEANDRDDAGTDGRFRLAKGVGISGVEKLI
jgi:hypothetical protein